MHEYTSLAAALTHLPTVVVDGRAVGGAELDTMARAHAAHVLALGFRAGDRLALMESTSPEAIAALIAHLRLGIVHVPVNTHYQAAEIEHVLTDSGATRVVPTTRTLPIEAWPAPPDHDALALIVYTSGTTGRAKGVMLSHRALAASLGAMMRLWGIGPNDVVCHALPLFHVHGLGLGLLGPLLVGARLRLRAKFTAAGVVDEFRSGATVLMSVPTMVHALVEHLATRPDDGVVLGRGRLFTAGSAALPAALLERFRAATGHTILERYGMTETLFTLSNPLLGERRPGVVGLPVPGVEVRLVDDDGAVVADMGEIEVRGPGLFDGYWGNPEATAAAYHDGWFKTGDVAAIDDGYYRIVGRRSTDIIKSGGFKIGAREIEDVLLTHPDIAEAAVLGVPDERWGELVVAAIVVRRQNADDLSEWCSTRLADYKRPRRFIVLEALPRNAMGKVMKAVLRRHFSEDPP